MGEQQADHQRQRGHHLEDQGLDTDPADLLEVVKRCTTTQNTIGATIIEISFRKHR